MPAERDDMKALKDETLDVLEDVAHEGAKQIKAFFIYQGDNPNYFNKARLGAVAISALGRVRASETNRMIVERKARKDA
jgi:hypothetical protein